jgi:signal transduction histidine kinase
MDLQAVIDKMTARWRKDGLPDFVWWIPVVFFGTTLAGLGIAVVQRVGEHPILPVLGLALVAAAPCLMDAAGIRTHYTVYFLLSVGATAALASVYPVAYDFAPAVWAMTAGHFAATESFRRSSVATALTCVVIAGLGLSGQIDAAALWVPAVILAGDIGFVLQYQQRKLDTEREQQAERQARAVLEERQRIAREVHDVVAHSLSVTMLHLTAARRDLEQDGADGVADAIDALRDAERVGREAMTDIRHTVGFLTSETPADATASAPDLGDVPTLVDGFRAAGLDVDLDLRGDTKSVPPNDALAIYRILQESLANVAKHEPRSRAAVLLDLTDGQRVRVTNDLNGSPRRTTGGAGLKGIEQRVGLLGGSFRAGEDAGRWTVEVVVPGKADAKCLRDRLVPRSVAPETA